MFPTFASWSTEMKTHSGMVAAILVGAATIVPGSFAGDLPPLSSYPQITAAAANNTQTELFIQGKNFGTAAPSVIMLGGVKLGTPRTSLSNLIVVALPPALPPGSYPLWIQSFTSLAPGSAPLGLWSYISVTLGAVGAQGPQGPKGDKGDQGDRGLLGLKGDKGDKGDQGNKGDAGDPGSPGRDGERGPEGPQGPPGPAGSGGVVSLLQRTAALLRWYEIGETFPAGDDPSALAFDGTNIWIANSNANSIVTRLRASDGACVDPCHFFVNDGAIPKALAFDGANIWVASAFSGGGPGSVTRLRAADGACISPCSFPVGVDPDGIAFDGANIWVTNTGSDNVSKLRASDGGLLGTLAISQGNHPIGVAFDGAHIWVANNGNGVLGGGSYSIFRASDGIELATYGVCLSGCPTTGVAFDGVHVWITAKGSTDSAVIRLTTGDNPGAQTGSTPLGAVNPVALAFDGTNMWVVKKTSNQVSKLRASDGVVLGTFDVGLSPVAVAFDGANIWVANSGSGTVSRLPDF
jgi:hypothetical protein